jgi:diguanylate cyclase (GGDEF)-like protein
VPAGPEDLAARLRLCQDALRRQLSRADVLADLLRAVNASLEPERVAEAMLSRFAEWLPASAVAVIGALEGTGARTLAARGLEPRYERCAHAVAGWVLRTGEALLAADLARDRRAGVAEHLAVIAYPLMGRGRPAGVFVGLDHQPSSEAPRLAPATRVALESALAAAGIALETAARVQRAEALSVTDDLTSLYNSRYLSQVLRREVKRAGRSNRPLSLLFLDLDGFKSVNDSHGHLAGSRTLVEAATVIRMSARETDVVARFGGDEFALVLPDTGTPGAEAVAERVRERLAAHTFLADEGLDIRLTASVGVATLPDVAESAETLIQAADCAMYRVKAAGKNGVAIAGTGLAP